MMRRSCAWIVMVALVMGFVLPALAQTAAPAAPAAKPAEPAKSGDAAKATAKTKSATGMVKTASADSLTVVGKDKKEWTFVVDKDTKVSVGDKKVEPKDLKANDSATVTFAEADGKMVAKTVKVKAAAKPKS